MGSVVSQRTCGIGGARHPGDQSDCLRRSIDRLLENRVIECRASHQPLPTRGAPLGGWLPGRKVFSSLPPARWCPNFTSARFLCWRSRGRSPACTVDPRRCSLSHILSDCPTVDTCQTGIAQVTTPRDTTSFNVASTIQTGAATSSTRDNHGGRKRDNSHRGSGTAGTVYTFCSACWYSPKSALIPSNSRFTAAR